MCDLEWFVVVCVVVCGVWPSWTVTLFIISDQLFLYFQSVPHHDRTNMGLHYCFRRISEEESVLLFVAR